MAECVLNAFYSPAQCERYASVLPRRYSCRAYKASPDAAQLAALNYAAARVCLPGTRIAIADCPDNLFVRVPLVEHIHGTGKYACVIADMRQRLPRTLAGISGEAFVLEAAAMGVDSCWVSGTYRRSAVDIPLDAHEKVLAVLPLGIAAGEAPPMRKRKSLAQICLTPPDQWPLWAYQAAEAVRRAPSAVNLQPWRLSYAQHTLRLLGRRADSLDMGIAMLHIEAAVKAPRRHWEWGTDKCVAHLIVEEKA